MGDLIPLDPIAAVFGASGALSRAFQGYAPREGQVSFARASHEVLQSGGGLAAECPCGTGKGLAYLVPSILRAVRTNERVIVATAGIPLQEQLVTKDLPSLKSVLAPMIGTDWRFALLKGRSNYACLSLIHEPEQRAEWEGALTNAERDQLMTVDQWAMTSDTGDRTELPFVASDNVWRLRSMDRDDCHGKSCDHYEECFARKAHERAAQSAVVVVNYHLLFAHIAVRAETGRDVILPEYHALVMDEAHEAGDIARDFFGHTLSEGRVKRIVRWLRNARRAALSAGVECSADEGIELSDAADVIERTAAEFFSVCAQTMAPLLAKREKINTLRSDSPLCATANSALAALIEPLTLARKLGLRIHARVKRMLREGAELGDHVAGGASKHVLRVQRDAERAARAAVKALSWMEHATHPTGTAREPGELDAIHWIAVEDKQTKSNRPPRITWESRHIDLSAVLNEHVWRHTRAVIACSATMTTGNGDRGWTWIRRQLGTPRDVRTLSVASPFDFARQALLCLPSDAPNPTKDREGFDFFAVETMRQVMRAAGGRTLGLFTSTRMAQAAGRDLHATAHARGIRVLVQGDMPRTQLVAAFKRDETSVLCGTTSLWTGVDVQGNACVCVVIDKLPFAPPGDPVLDALCERAVARTGRTIAGFMEESLPRAVLALRQGVGRLIRGVDDWGCVVLCDPRLMSKGYGADILRSLGMPVRTRSVTAACEWLERGVRGMEANRTKGRAVNE